MKKIVAEITGSSSLQAQFVLQHAESGRKQSKKNVRRGNFQVQENEKYVMLVEVIGNNGTPYKLKIDKASKATYPDSDQVIDEGRDFLLARITG